MSPPLWRYLCRDGGRNALDQRASQQMRVGVARDHHFEQRDQREPDRAACYSNRKPNESQDHDTQHVALPTDRSGSGARRLIELGRDAGKRKPAKAR